MGLEVEGMKTEFHNKILKLTEYVEDIDIVRGYFPFSPTD